MQQTAFHPYTQTHKLVFRQCRKLRMLQSELGEQAINQMFIDALTKAGFEIARDKNGIPRVQSHPFGEDEGYTSAAVLTSSDAAIHTYPQRHFNRVMQLRFTLSYLSAGVVEKYNASVEKAERIFRKLTGCRSSSRYSSHTDYL